MNNYIKIQLDQIDQRIADIKHLLEDPEMADLANEEIKELEAQKVELSSVIASPEGARQSNSNQIASSPMAPRNDIAILEVRSAAGGDEAGLFAGDLTHMYLKFAARKGWKIEELDRSEGNLGQIKELVLKITGKDAYANLKYESGE